ncbi:MAG TPA: sigma-70 family RNA polymerase sigma factor [Thermoanaerobaculia bacterium]|jgi:RNA polymerase sigma-70 factor (ECF subfamily)|nr:sigma-70 family RNA polymerase sigma factor [Thermoanaerobaculia bacterium]
MSGTGSPRLDAPELADDARLVDEFLRTRSNGVFEILVDRHKGKIFRLALAVLGPGFEAEAEEVTQEVFVTAFRQLPSFRKESAFGTWLYRIAQRKAIDLRNSARVRHPHAPEETLEAMTPRGGDDASPHGRAEARQNRRVLLAAVRELPEPYPQILRLFYWLDWSVAEISETLGMAPGTVKSHLFRARHLLSERLREKGAPHADPLP